MAASAFLNQLAKKSKETEYDKKTGAKINGLQDDILKPAKSPKKLPRASEVQTPAKARALPATNLFAGMTELPRPGRLPTATEAAKKKQSVKINTDSAPRTVFSTVNPTIVPKADMTKSTAKDEKTRLYQTNDSLLTNDEIFKKYEYVLNDKDMDYATMKRAAKKGMELAGKLVQSSPDMNTYKRATQMQIDLQGKLKSTAAAAGLLESMGGTVQGLYARGVKKISPETGAALENLLKQQRAQFEQAQEENSGYYTGGNAAGEFAKMAALYQLVGEPAEQLALKGAGALGARMSAATAPDMAQKAYALAKYNPRIAAAAKFGVRMLGQQAADTAVLAPLVAAEGIAEGQSKEEMLKEFAKQEAIAAGFNVGMAGLGKAAKIIGGKAAEASRRGPIAGIDFERIKYAHARPDENLMEFRRKAAEGSIRSGANYELSPPNARLADDIEKITGISVRDFGTKVSAGQMGHIEKRHGKNGIHDHSMANEEDFGKIQYILNNYDEIIPGKKATRAYKNADGTNGKTILMSKRINGTYYVVEAVPDNKQKSLRIISAYKKGDLSSAAARNAAEGQNAVWRTSETSLNSPPNQSITENGREVNLQAMAGAKATAKNEIDYAALHPKDIQELHNLKYRQEQAVKEARKGVKLSEKDEEVLQGLMLAKPDDAVLARNIEQYNPDVLAIYRAERALSGTKKQLSDYKKHTKKRYYDIVKNAVGEIHLRDGKTEGWHDKETPFFYARETQERNLYDIAPNKETADKIREAILDPIHTNERDRLLFSNGLKERIKQVKVSTRKNIAMNLPEGKMKISESGLVQWLGEKRYQMQRLQEAGAMRSLSAQGKEQLERLRTEINAAEAAVTPEQLARINAGIQTYQQIYKEIHPLINEALIRNGYEPVGYIEGYFPHMNFDDPENLMEAAFSKMGFDFSAKELPMDLAGRTETFRPGKKWSGNLLQRKGTKTDYDAARAFDLYIDNISDVIYHTDDIQRLRAYEDYFRYNLSEKGIQEQIKAIRNDPAIEDVDKASRIERLYQDNAKNHKMQNYVMNLRTYTDTQLAGKKHISDRGVESQYAGRKFYKRINTLGSRVSANMVAGNIGSALTNIIPITQATGSIGVKNSVKGLNSAMDAFMRGAGKDALTRKSAFLTTRRGLDMLYETGLQKVSKKAGALMEIMDSFSTQVVWRGRYFDNMAKGLDEDAAIKEADRFCRGLFAGRSKGSMPNLFMSKHPITKTLSAFQLEVNNQISFFLKDVPRNAQGNVRKVAQAYCGAIIMGHIYNDFYEKATGRRSALDPLDYANKFIGEMTGTQWRNVIDVVKDIKDGEGLKLTEKTTKWKQAQKKGEEFQPKPSDAITGLTENIGGQVPFIGGLVFDGGRVPIQSAFVNPKTILSAYADEKAGQVSEGYGNEVLKKELKNGFFYGALPFGGAQAKKTYEGLKTMAQGGSYNQTKQGKSLQFAADQKNPLNWLQAGAFGKWALPEGRAYFEGEKGLDAKRTKTYEALVKGGVKNTRAYQIISNIQSKGKGEEKRSAIRWTALPKEQQAILYYDLAASDEDKALMDYFNMRAKTGKGKKEDIGEVYDCLSRMAEHGSKVLPKRNIIREINLSDEDKKHIYMTRVVTSDNVAKESKCISTLEKAGIRFDDYLSIKNKYGTLYNQKGIGSKQKKAEFDRWLREQGFTWEQQRAISEEFVFWGMYRQK